MKPKIAASVRDFDIRLIDGIASFQIRFDLDGGSIGSSPIYPLWGYAPIFIELVEFFRDLRDAEGTMVLLLVDEDNDVLAMFDLERPDQKSVFFSDDKQWKDE